MPEHFEGYCVDGYEFPTDDSNLAGDGEFPPFLIFDTRKQDYLPGSYATRAEANAALRRLTYCPPGEE